MVVAIIIPRDRLVRHSRQVRAVEQAPQLIAYAIDADILPGAVAAKLRQPGKPLRNSPYRSVSRLRGKLRRTGNFFAFGPDSLRWIPGRERR